MAFVLVGLVKSMVSAIACERSTMSPYHGHREVTITMLLISQSTLTSASLSKLEGLSLLPQMLKRAAY